MNKKDWEAKNHKKELKTLGELVKRIVQGIFLIRSIRVDQDFIVKNGYRVTMYLKEKDKK